MGSIVEQLPTSLGEEKIRIQNRKEGNRNHPCRLGSWLSSLCGWPILLSSEFDRFVVKLCKVNNKDNHRKALFTDIKEKQAVESPDRQHSGGPSHVNRE